MLTPAPREASVVARFLHFSTALSASCAARSEVIGLIFVGSAADIQRIDQWSDHDFFVITKNGEQEKLRQDLSWLPNFEKVAFSFRETAHGLKVLYLNGAVLEFAIFDCAELASCKVNHHALVFGSPEVAKALSTAAARLSEPTIIAPLVDFRLFLSLLVIGVGRARRGELLTAGIGIRSSALSSLIKVFSQWLGPDERMDQLDLSRRFETVHPILGARLAKAVAHEPELAARELLQIAGEFLPGIWPGYPHDNVDVVQRVLGWNE